MHSKLGDNRATLESLNTLSDAIEKASNKVNNQSYQLKCHYLFAMTYEAEGEYEKAINELKKIENMDKSALGSEETVYARSFLNLGRLHFRNNNLDDASNKLLLFFNNAKKINNEILDLARVNLGMINGAQAFDNHIKHIKETGFDNYLNMKLNNFKDK